MWFFILVGVIAIIIIIVKLYQSVQYKIDCTMEFFDKFNKQKNKYLSDYYETKKYLDTLDIRNKDCTEYSDTISSKLFLQYSYYNSLECRRAELTNSLALLKSSYNDYKTYEKKGEDNFISKTSNEFYCISANIDKYRNCLLTSQNYSDYLNLINIINSTIDYVDELKCSYKLNLKKYFVDDDDASRTLENLSNLIEYAGIEVKKTVKHSFFESDSFSFCFSYENLQYYIYKNFLVLILDEAKEIIEISFVGFGHNSMMFSIKNESGFAYPFLKSNGYVDFRYKPKEYEDLYKKVTLYIGRRKIFTYVIGDDIAYYDEESSKRFTVDRYERQQEELLNCYITLLRKNKNITLKNMLSVYETFIMNNYKIKNRMKNKKKYQFFYFCSLIEEKSLNEICSEKELVLAKNDFEIIDSFFNDDIFDCTAHEYITFILCCYIYAFAEKDDSIKNSILTQLEKYHYYILKKTDKFIRKGFESVDALLYNYFLYCLYYLFMLDPYLNKIFKIHLDEYIKIGHITDNLNDYDAIVKKRYSDYLYELEYFDRDYTTMIKKLMSIFDFNKNEEFCTKKSYECFAKYVMSFDYIRNHANNRDISIDFDYKGEKCKNDKVPKLFEYFITDNLIDNKTINNLMLNYIKDYCANIELKNAFKITFFKNAFNIENFKNQFFDMFEAIEYHNKICVPTDYLLLNLTIDEFKKIEKNNKQLYDEKNGVYKSTFIYYDYELKNISKLFNYDDYCIDNNITKSNFILLNYYAYNEYNNDCDFSIGNLKFLGTGPLLKMFNGYQEIVDLYSSSSIFDIFKNDDLRNKLESLVDFISKFSTLSSKINNINENYSLSDIANENYDKIQINNDYFINLFSFFEIRLEYIKCESKFTKAVKTKELDKFYNLFVLASMNVTYDFTYADFSKYFDIIKMIWNSKKEELSLDESSLFICSLINHYDYDSYNDYNDFVDKLETLIEENTSTKYGLNNLYSDLQKSLYKDENNGIEYYFSCLSSRIVQKIDLDIGYKLGIEFVKNSYQILNILSNSISKTITYGERLNKEQTFLWLLITPNLIYDFSDITVKYNNPDCFLTKKEMFIDFVNTKNISGKFEYFHRGITLICDYENTKIYLRIPNYYFKISSNVYKQSFNIDKNIDLSVDKITEEEFILSVVKSVNTYNKENIIDSNLLNINYSRNFNNDFNANILSFREKFINYSWANNKFSEISNDLNLIKSNYEYTYILTFLRNCISLENVELYLYKYFNENSEINLTENKTYEKAISKNTINEFDKYYKLLKNYQQVIRDSFPELLKFLNNELNEHNHGLIFNIIYSLVKEDISIESTYVYDILNDAYMFNFYDNNDLHEYYNYCNITGKLEKFQYVLTLLKLVDDIPDNNSFVYNTYDNKSFYYFKSLKIKMLCKLKSTQILFLKDLYREEFDQIKQLNISKSIFYYNLITSMDCIIYLRGIIVLNDLCNFKTNELKLLFEFNTNIEKIYDLISSELKDGVNTIDNIFNNNRIEFADLGIKDTKNLEILIRFYFDDFLINDNFIYNKNTGVKSVSEYIVDYIQSQKIVNKKQLMNIITNKFHLDEKEYNKQLASIYSQIIELNTIDIALVKDVIINDETTDNILSFLDLELYDGFIQVEEIFIDDISYESIEINGVSYSINITLLASLLEKCINCKYKIFTLDSFTKKGYWLIVDSERYNSINDIIDYIITEKYEDKDNMILNKIVKCVEGYGIDKKVIKEGIVGAGYSIDEYNRVFKK